MKMDENTFWILFWIVIFTYFSVTNYFNEQTKQMKIKSNYEIAKMKNESNKMLNDTMCEMTKSIKK